MNKKKIAQIVISLTLIIILLNWIDFNEVKHSLINAKYEYFVIAFLIIIFDRILMAYKWILLLKTKKINISLFNATKIYYIGNFLGLFLPSTIGNDIVRAYYVSKKGVNKTDVISVIIMERILGFICLAIVALIGAFLLIDIFKKPTFESNGLITIVILLITIGMASFVISLNKRLTDLIVRFLQTKKEKKYWGKFIPAAIDLINSYTSHKDFKIVLIIFSFLTVLQIFVGILFTYIVAIGLNVEISFVYFLSFLPFVILLGRLPISFDGFGVKEGLFVYFLSLVNISAATAFNVGLINHLITIIGILPGGIFYAFNKDYKKIKPLKDSIADSPTERPI